MKSPVFGVGKRLRQLSVYLYDFYVGEAFQDELGRIGFQYAPSYVSSGSVLPISLSMPVVAEVYGADKVEPFLWGLLPENRAVLERIAREHHVSPGNPIALLSIIGEECAGAVRFIQTAPSKAHLSTGSVEWLSDEQVGALLADLRNERGSIGRRRDDAGQFSLGGAQSKTALHFDEACNRWGVPFGVIPTTHIFKPPMAGLQGQVENEHFCLQLAKELDCPTAESRVMEFVGEQAIVVTRYDRLRMQGGTVVRIHQEDMCQALSVMPGFKYQREGGPSMRDISALITVVSENPEDDMARFIRAAVFNFVILGTDAHAKNFSFIIAPSSNRPLFRLAPLYDLISYLPYQENPRKTRLAMSVGGKYFIHQITPRHWISEAEFCGVDTDATLNILRDVIASAPDLAQIVADRCKKDALKAPIIPKLVELISERCKQLAKQYA